jgi:hypothetical protein
MVRTDHILFIAAGAFHVSKPSDLIPELQGRFPIRVELEALGREDFVRILTEPKSALVKQYTALLSTRVSSSPSRPGAIERIADYATIVNERTENIGARRLHTVMEKLLDQVSFDAPELTDRIVVIDEAYVDRMLADIVRKRRSLALRSLMRRRLRPGLTSILICWLAAACGQKGPPLAPLHLVPAAVSEPAVRRVGDRVRLRFVLPNRNENGPDGSSWIGWKFTR